MEFSGTYNSIQSVSKGDLVQLVYDEKGKVMKVYEKGEFSYAIPDLQNIKQIAIYQQYLALVQEIGRGQLLVKLYQGTNLLWTDKISGLNIVDTSLIFGPAGIFLIFSANGVVFLPNNSGIDLGWDNELSRLLIRLNTNGTMIGNTIIKGPYAIKLDYDILQNRALIYGNSTLPLFMSGVEVIRSEVLYGFVIYLSPTLTPLSVIESEGIIIDKLTASSGNIAFTNVREGLSYLNFVSVNDDKWSSILSIRDVRNIIIFNSQIWVVGPTNDINTWIIEAFTYTNNRNVQNTLPIKGTPIKVSFGYAENVNNRFLLYAIASIPGGYILTEYDIFENIIVWSLPTIENPIVVSGTLAEVAVANEDTLYMYGKRLPALVGAVDQILVTGGTGGPIVKVDFLLTTAFAPVVPGQEYFYHSNGRVSSDAFMGRYVGTALDDSKVFMHATFPV